MPPTAQRRSLSARSMSRSWNVHREARLGRITHVEDQIEAAQEALKATSRLMRQDAQSFVMTTVARRNTWKKTPSPEAGGTFQKFGPIRPAGPSGDIPDEFFAQLESEVHKHIDAEKGPSRALSPISLRSAGQTPLTNASFTQSQGQLQRSGVGRSPELVADVPTESTLVMPMQSTLSCPPSPASTNAKSAKGSPRPRAKTDGPYAEVQAKNTSGNESRKKPIGPSAQDDDKLYEHGTMLSIAFANAPTPERMHGFGIGPSQATQAGLKDNIESTAEKKPLLATSYDEILEHLKDTTEVLRFEAGSENEDTRSSLIDAVPFWERKRGTRRQEEKYELSKAIWLLRKHLRVKYGSAEKAWGELEDACRKPVGAANDATSYKAARLADTLSLSELYSGLSRLGIKIPSVTGYWQVKKLLRELDKDGTNHLTFIEFMGDDNVDRTLSQDPPGERDAYAHMPRWARSWEQGYFDKDMLDHLICRDCIWSGMGSKAEEMEERKRKNVKIVPKGYKPIWRKYQEVMDQRRQDREDERKRNIAKEMEECTFSPDMEYSMVTGTKILEDKRRRRATSQLTMTAREKREQEYREAVAQLDPECTFQPSVVPRSRTIFSTMVEHGEGLYARMEHKVLKAQERVADEARKKQEEEERLNPFKRAKARARTAEGKGTNRKVRDQFFAEIGKGSEVWEKVPNTPRGDGRKTIPSIVPADVTSRLWVVEAKKKPLQEPSPEPDVPSGQIVLEYKAHLLGLMEAADRWGINPLDDEKDPQPFIVEDSYMVEAADEDMYEDRGRSPKRGDQASKRTPSKPADLQSADSATQLQMFAQAVFARFGDITSAFNAYDLFKDGAVSLSEFKAVSDNLQFKGDAEIVFKALDTRKAGAISRRDFQKLRDMRTQSKPDSSASKAKSARSASSPPSRPAR